MRKQPILLRTTPLSYKPWLPILVLLMGSLFPTQIPLGAEQPPLNTTKQFSGKQGEVLWFEIPVDDRSAKVTGQLFKRTMPFFPYTNTSFAGLVGIDMQDPPGQHTLQINIKGLKQKEQLAYSLIIEKENYTVQHLKLPKNKVDLDSKTLKRVRLEQKEMSNAFRHIGPVPLWDQPFLEPVKGRISGRFGSRRVINGQHKRPHSGEDIAAPTGTPVYAINAGNVVATVDHFFSGKGVIIDHGVGLFSMYFHLSEIDVQSGQALHKGDTLGKVGSTGRATGPHLHWGIRLNGARVNPYALTTLPIRK